MGRGVQYASKPPLSITRRNLSLWVAQGDYTPVRVEVGDKDGGLRAELGANLPKIPRFRNGRRRTGHARPRRCHEGVSAAGRRAARPLKRMARVLRRPSVFVPRAASPGRAIGAAFLLPLSPAYARQSSC